MTILQTIKDCLNVDNEETGFDMELEIHISSAIDDLKTVGVGITEQYNTAYGWDIFPSKTAFDETLQGMLKQYIFIAVKLMFDPPLPATMKVFEERKNTLLWQIRTHYDTFKTSDVSGEGVNSL